MEPYLLVKTLHILSATLLFGTGLGIAFFFWSGGRAGDDRAALFAARATVRADFLFTLTAVVLQPASGAWLIGQGGFDWRDRWLVEAYALYLVAGVCWLPVVWIQLRIRELLAAKVAGEAFDEARYRWLRACWFALGWPAFLGLILVFHLMVAKPGW